LVLVALLASYLPARRQCAWIPWWRCSTNRALSDELERLTYLALTAAALVLPLRASR
jgi:hypothetical protein